MQQPMIARNIRIILYVAGGLMLLAGLQFIAPVPVLQAQGLAVSDGAGLLFARHWGLLVACLGGLLVYSARRPELRTPVILAATIEKSCLIAVLSDPALGPMRPVIVLDGVFVVLFLMYLLGKRDGAS